MPIGTEPAVPVEAIKFNFTDNINRSRHSLTEEGIQKSTDGGLETIRPRTLSTVLTRLCGASLLRTLRATRKSVPDGFFPKR